MNKLTRAGADARGAGNPALPGMADSLSTAGDGLIHFPAMLSRRQIVIIVSAAVVLAGWMGYNRAYTAAVTADGMDKSSSTNERRSRPAGSRSDKMEDLRQLLKRPVNSRTSAEEWTIISGFSIRQIKDSLKTLSSGDQSEAVRNQAAMLYFCWGQIDPLQALEAAKRAGKKGDGMNQMIHAAWMKQDPEAAYHHALSSPETSRYAHSMMAKLLSSLPMNEALEKATSYGPEVRRIVLSSLGGTMAGTAGEREAFLAALARSGSDTADSSAVSNSFARTWGAVDPAAALAGLKDLPMDDGTRERTRNQITRYWTEKDPAAVITWMTSADNPQPLANQVEVYRNWAEKATDEAVKQFDALSRQSPGFRDEVMKSLVISYYQGGWIPFGRSERTDGEMFSRLKNHYDQWTTSDPADASTWLESLEPALQERLTSSDHHERN